MVDFTTIQITKSVRDKLDLMKGENNLTYNQLITNLLEQAGGSYVEDIVHLQREQVAFSLKYMELDNANNDHITDVTYHDLRVYPVGSVFTGCDDTNTSVDFVNSTATLIYRKGDDVVLLLEDISCRRGKVNRMSSIVHINLF